MLIAEEVVVGLEDIDLVSVGEVSTGDMMLFL